MTIKLIAIDIDGTLIDSNHHMHPDTIHGLNKKTAEGVKIVLCSGRPIIGMLPFIKELGLEQEDQYAISYNGALVQHNANLETIISHTLTYEDFLKVSELSSHLQVSMHTVDLEKMYTANRHLSPYTIFDAYATKMPLHYLPINEVPTDSIISKMMFCEEPATLATAIQKIPTSFFEEYTLIHSMPFFFEILNKKASKGQALRDLSQFLNIQPEEVMAIGDNENDLDMLTFAGIGIAMANGTENAKKSANHITKSNDDLGVAFAVNTWA